MRAINMALAAFLLFTTQAVAGGWTFRGDGGGQAGYAADGDWAGLWFACTPQGARIAVSTGGTRLQAGVDQTVVVDVDGVAFLQRMRFGAPDGGAVLGRNVARGELRTLAEALAKGRKAEIAMPAGRFPLPLKGSGKAIQAFLAACP